MALVMHGIFSAIIPFAAAFFAERKKVESVKKRVYISMSVMLLVNLAVAACWFFQKENWTCFEFLGINSACTALCIHMLLPLFRKNFKHTDILNLTCNVCVIAAVYSILTYGQTIIHSDTATATLLSRSQIQNRSLFPATWNYANGDIWFITNSTFTFPFAVLMENQPLARMLGSALYALITCIAVAYHSKSGFKNNSWLLALPLLLVFLYGEAADMVLYQVGYVGLMMWLCLCSILLFKASYLEKKRYSILFFLLLASLSVAGVRTIAEITIPLLCGYFVTEYFRIREQETITWKPIVQKCLYTFALVLTSAIVGLVIYIWQRSCHNMGNTSANATVFVESINECWNNLLTTVLNFFVLFGYSGNTEMITVMGFRNMISIIMCLIVVLIVPFLQAKRIHREDIYTQFFFAFTMIHNAIMVLMAVLFEKTTARYMLTSLFMLIILSSRYIYVYWINQQNFRKCMWSILFACATVVVLIPMLMQGTNWQTALADRREIMQQIVDRGLTKGYATYWNAYSNEIYSDCKLRFGGIILSSAGIEPYNFLVDNQVFEIEDKNTFLLLSESENQWVQSKSSWLIEETIEAFSVDDTYIYIYDHDIARYFRNGISDGIVQFNELNRTEGVDYSAGHLVLDAGDVVFGPYDTIEAGEYIVTYRGNNLDACAFDAYSGKYYEAIQCQVLEIDETEVVMAVSILSDIDDIEFRVFGQLETELSYLHEITIDRLEGEV